MTSAKFAHIFARLRGILAGRAQSLLVSADTPERYCLEGPVGPAMLQAWKGKKKKPTIEVAWVQVGKAYVSFHLMGLYCDGSQTTAMSPKLQARMQGKTCFNFKAADETLFKELEGIAERAIIGFRRAGFVE